MLHLILLVLICVAIYFQDPLYGACWYSDLHGSRSNGLPQAERDRLDFATDFADRELLRPARAFL